MTLKKYTLYFKGCFYGYDVWAYNLKNALELSNAKRSDIKEYTVIGGN